MIRVRTPSGERILSVEAFEAHVRQGDISPFAEVCLPAITGDRFVAARELSLFAALHDPRRMLFQRHFHLGRLPVVTGAFTLVCIALFLYARALGAGAVTRDALLLLGAKARAPMLDEGELWRLLTANLLHRDSTHLAFNMFALLNIGTVLEGVYRRGEYVVLLVVGGLSTMALSSVMSIPITVGASGVIFCCLGAAVVFGLRFSELLPLRYRMYFGVVVVAYAAAMFYLGLQRAGTDNWGHAGGLLSGFVMGALLEPRLMKANPQLLRSTAWRAWALAAGIVVLIVVAGPIVPRIAFHFEPYRFDSFGIEISRPSTWTKGPDPLGFLAFGNGVDALTSIACAHREAPRSVDGATAHFVDEELGALALRGSIFGLDVAAVSVDTIDGVDARLVPFSFTASDGPFAARTWVFVRGEMECAFVVAQRKGARAHSVAILDEIRARVRFVATKAQREAQNGVLNRPHDPRAQLEMALAHQAAGEVAGARAAFAVAMTTSDPTWLARVRLANARFELLFGGDFDAALRDAHNCAQADPTPQAYALWVQILTRRGDAAAARRVLAEALAQFGEVSELAALTHPALPSPSP